MYHNDNNLFLETPLYIHLYTVFDCCIFVALWEDMGCQPKFPLELYRSVVDTN